MYSAIKRDGQPLYKLARAGVTVARAPRDIEIHELTLKSADPDSLTLETLCSKGTYVRTLAEDLAQRLRTVGHVTFLRRLAVEPFEGEAMQTLESLEALSARGDLPPLVPPERALAHLPAVSLTPEALLRLRHGQPVHIPGAPTAARLRLHTRGMMVGLGECTAGGNVQPRRMFISDTD
jgi:tRNA pseudouridine55 synthase